MGQGRRSRSQEKIFWLFRKPKDFFADLDTWRGGAMTHFWKKFQKVVDKSPLLS
jgi:hypothetical protein